MAVAAGDISIVHAVKQAGGTAVLTDPGLPSGSDRILAALDILDPERRHDVVVNLQGDMPFVQPSVLSACADLLGAHPGCDIATVVAPEASPVDRTNPDVVKAVLAMEQNGLSGRALYFTRSDPLRRRADLAAHRHLRLSPRGPGGLQRRPALAAGEAREAGAAAGHGAGPRPCAPPSPPRPPSPSTTLPTSKRRAPIQTPFGPPESQHEHPQEDRLPGRARRQQPRGLPHLFPRLRGRALRHLRGGVRGHQVRAPASWA